MNPDETKIALWLDDELSGEELAEMEEWASTRPDQLQIREDFRKYRQTLATAVPASEEPPYPDFFMTRVRQGIRDIEAQKDLTKANNGKASTAPFWKSWLMPVAACAGIVLAFNLGRQGAVSDARVADVKSSEVSPSPVVYTPEEGVDARWYVDNEADASVIVLAGVSAIPDSTDFSQTVYVPTSREFDRTATREDEPSDTSQQ